MQASSNWQASFNSLKLELPGYRNRVIRVVLLGQPGVGKTAIAVRFLCRRFIGEYDSSKEWTYKMDGALGCWEISDPPGDPFHAPSESRLRWADAVVLVYSVTDRVSFDEVWRLRFLLNQARKSTRRQPVVALVGNKADLCGPTDADRMVTTAEGQRRADQIEAQVFYEISVRESIDQVMSIFASVARQVVAGDELHAASFRLRASTDGSIDARRRGQQFFSKRRLSISSRGAPE